MRERAGEHFRSRDHRQWRPEWRVDRPCLYWYLEVGGPGCPDPRPPGAVDALGGTPWLDVVAPRWMHLTLCDVGFVDQLAAHEVAAVVAAVGDVADRTDPVDVRLGPPVALGSAVTLAATPFGGLRALQHEVRTHTCRALGPDRPMAHVPEFWPHVSLGYTNAEAPGPEVADLLARLAGSGGTVRVDRLTLARVVRRGGHYEWTVVTDLPLGRAAAPPLGTDRSRRPVSAGTARRGW